MNQVQSFSIKEWVTDIDEKYLSPSQSFYLKNREFFVNIHGSMSGENIGKTSTNAANYKACDLTFPAGENYSTGVYSSDKTNEVYIFITNSNDANFIYRINGNQCDIIYDEILPGSYEPKNAVTQFRACLMVNKTCRNWGGKRLVWANGLHIGCIDVEASLSTQSFTTPFFANCSNKLDLVSLCVPTPMSCLSATYLPKTISDKLLPNKIVDVGFQFMYRWVYYDGRKSTWSEPSSYYFQSSKECFENEGGFSRCMKIRIPAGNSQVVVIEFAFRNDNTTSWKIAERIEKYEPYASANQQWFERVLSPLISGNNYSLVDCSFDYTFCNDKQCEAIDPTDSNRVYNPFPRNAQGLFPFKETLAFYNYRKGNCPLPKSVADNTRITFECTDEVTCTKEYANVTVYSVIHNFKHSRNQVVYSEDANIDAGIVEFGGLNDALSGGFERGWGQNFAGTAKNFIVYVEGAEDYNNEMKQWKRDSSGGRTEAGIISNMGDTSVRNGLRRTMRRGSFFYQKATIKVPKGTKGFIRLSSHLSEKADDTTSTHVVGKISLDAYKGDKNLGSSINPSIDRDKEIYFDTCTGDQDLWTQALVIRDNAVDGGIDPKASAISGYIKDPSGNPLEGLLVGINFPDAAIPIIPAINRTDHNGFYSVLSDKGFNSDIEIIVKGELNSTSFQEIKSQAANIGVGEMTVVDIKIEDIDYIDKRYLKAVVKVHDCNGGVLSGIRVAMSGSKSKASNSNGDAIFKIRNYDTKNRVLRATIIDKNGCFNVGCDNQCNPCQPLVSSQTPPSYANTPELSIGILTLNINAILGQYQHLKNGGRYGFGIIAKGECGNLSFVNKGAGSYLDIPKKCGGNKSCSLSYDFTGMVLPLWVNTISIVRTKNINPFELQWVVDKVEYIDGKVRLTIQSLNDYNLAAGFKSNTIYQYLDGDRIEIIADENGKYFCESLNYQVLSPFHDKVLSGKTDAPADYFNQLLIEDDGRIGKQLVKGSIIEMQRPNTCETDDIYYTTCNNIPVVNGLPLYPTGKFNTFDTYTINRKIGTNPSLTFEHHSPSDFWGKGITDIGHPHIVNKFEDEKIYERNITIADTDDLNSFGLLEKTVGDASMGGIVAANIADDKIIFILCENDSLIQQSADNLLRINNDGNVVASTGEQAISDAQPKLQGRYGCRLDDVGSVYFGDGYVTWMDVQKGAYILHDYSTAKEVSFLKISAWTLQRCQEMKAWNQQQADPLNKYRWATGYNHLTKNLMLTVKKLRDSGIDNSLIPFESKNETIVYNPEQDRFYGLLSATPEGYGMINMFNGKGAAYVVVNHGDAWIQPVIPERFGESFGVAIDQVVGIILNKFPEKVKIAQAIEIQDEKMWFATKVTTDKSTFISEIPPSRVKKIMGAVGKWNAAFLSNINGRGGLYGNTNTIGAEKARGYFVKIILVRDNTINLEYKTINDNKRIEYSELDQILIKFSLAEQSGFTENL